MAAPAPRRVAVLLFDGAEELDFAGPYEVFAVAGRKLEPSPYEVYTVAAHSGPVTARGGLSVNPRYTLAGCPPPDVLIVPGGRGARQAVLDASLIAWIAQTAAAAELTLSVCTGSALLGRAGLLEGREATTHHTAFDFLRESAPGAVVVEGRRIAGAGDVLTSAGISAGIDLALHVVARHHGEDAARLVAREMEYRWQPEEDLA